MRKGACRFDAANDRLALVIRRQAVAGGAAGGEVGVERPWEKSQVILEETGFLQKREIISGRSLEESGAATQDLRSLKRTQKQQSEARSCGHSKV